MMDFLKLGIALAVVAACFGTGWTVQGWRKDADIAAIELKQSNDQVAVAEKAVKDMKEGSQKMHEAATELTGIKFNLSGKLDGISKDLKNAQTKNPLPHDCKPDDLRVRSLEAAISATNSAAAGQ